MSIWESYESDLIFSVNMFSDVEVTHGRTFFSRQPPVKAQRHKHHPSFVICTFFFLDLFISFVKIYTMIAVTMG